MPEGSCFKRFFLNLHRTSAKLKMMTGKDRLRNGLIEKKGSERKMSAKVTFDYAKTSPFISAEEVEKMKRQTLDAKEVLVSKSGAGNDFLGWIDLPVNYYKEEFARIKEAAKRIQEDSEVLLVIGIGGSYLGARAAIEFL